ncbi:hypothetical protein L218DRAFT_992434 [Marasmius fiardii PR-910]|nr:hypothetical protein L218DRAFT_992434 [Marasmius fiardii PR-910]
MVANRTLFFPFVLLACALVSVQQAKMGNFSEDNVPHIGQLYRRQLPNLGTAESYAPECKKTCDPVQATCIDATCACTNSNSDTLANCLDCFATHTNNATYTSQLQVVMDSYVALCKASGFTVKSQTVHPNGAPSVYPAVGSVIIGVVAAALFMS